MNYTKKEKLAALSISPTALSVVALLNAMPEGSLRRPGDKVYFIRCGGYVKIGYTRGAVEDRMNEFALGNPFKLDVLAIVRGPSSMEQSIHILLNRWHKGREWFVMRDAVKEVVDYLMMQKKGRENKNEARNDSTSGGEKA